MTPKTNEAMTLLTNKEILAKHGCAWVEGSTPEHFLNAMRESQEVAVKYALRQAAKKAEVFRDEKVSMEWEVNKDSILSLEKEIFKTLQQ